MTPTPSAVASTGCSRWSSRLTPTQGRTPGIVFSVAHLEDEERRVVLGLLLDEVLSWVRTLTGTQRLRALVVIDEVFGLLPPHPANPPTKGPIVSLTRAYGVGMVLATQNPMDLDYRALSNAGVWCIGRLQTDADRARVLEGLSLSGARHNRSRAASPNRQTTRQTLLRAARRTRHRSRLEVTAAALGVLVHARAHDAQRDQTGGGMSGVAWGARGGELTLPLENESGFIGSFMIALPRDKVTGGYSPVIGHHAAAVCAVTREDGKVAHLLNQGGAKPHQ